MRGKQRRTSVNTMISVKAINVFDPKAVKNVFVEAVLDRLILLSDLVTE